MTLPMLNKWDFEDALRGADNFERSASAILADRGRWQDWDYAANLLAAAVATRRAATLAALGY